MNSLIDPSSLVTHMTGEKNTQLLAKLAMQTGMFYSFSAPSTPKNGGNYSLYNRGNTCRMYDSFHHRNADISLEDNGWILVDDYTECSATQIRHWAVFIQTLANKSEPCRWMKKLNWMANQASELHIADARHMKGAGFTEISQIEIALILGSCFEDLNPDQLSKECHDSLNLGKRSIVMAFVDLAMALRDLIQTLEHKHDLHLPHNAEESACSLLLQAFEASCDIGEDKIYVITQSDTKTDAKTFKSLLSTQNKQMLFAPLTCIETLLPLMTKQITTPYRKKETNKCQ